MTTTLTEDVKGKTRAWLGVCNNYTNEDYQQLTEAECVYKIVGKEIGDSGTPHLQMYFYFKTEKSFKQMKELNKRAHWKVANGDSLQNYEYCSKDNNFIETGKRPMTQKEKGQAGKQLYEEAWKLAKAGEIESIDVGLRIKHYTTFKRLKLDFATKPDEIPVLNNEWIWGEPDTYKSCVARKENPGIYDKQLTKWWDMYEDQETILLDDFDKSHSWMYGYLKRWADHYPFNAEVKGCSRWIRPKRIIVTSNYRIEDIWFDDQTIKAIKRRFTVREIKKGEYCDEDFGIVRNASHNPRGTDSCAH